MQDFTKDMKMLKPDTQSMQNILQDIFNEIQNADASTIQFLTLYLGPRIFTLYLKLI